MKNFNLNILFSIREKLSNIILARYPFSGNVSLYYSKTPLCKEILSTLPKGVFLIVYSFQNYDQIISISLQYFFFISFSYNLQKNMK